jgi:DnaB-like helicase N terminal domain
MTLPSNLDAERFILGSILLDSGAYGQADGPLKPDDFSLEKHRPILVRLGELYHLYKAVIVLVAQPKQNEIHLFILQVPTCESKGESCMSPSPSRAASHSVSNIGESK